MSRLIGDSRIAWLHLSDIHLQPGNEDSYLSDKVLRSLVETLRRRESHLDFIFFTGDLAREGKDYSKAAKFFDDLLDAAGLMNKLGTKARERLFLVPGNHDIDMDTHPCLGRPIDDNDKSSEFFNPNGERRRDYFERLHRFIEFYNCYFDGIRKLTYEEPFISEVIPIKIKDNVLNIGIVGLMSTWFCQLNSDKNNLWVGERLCQEAFNNMDKKNYE